MFNLCNVSLLTLNKHYNSTEAQLVYISDEVAKLNTQKQTTLEENIMQKVAVTNRLVEHLQPV
jgi:hypothetical protein